MNRPALSVLIPTFNRSKFIPYSLNSVLGQSLPPHQVIVINDGSTDDTEKVLQPYSQRIQYLKKENEGKPSAVNAGLEHVTGDYVWIVDDDDVMVPDAWERHSTVLQQGPEIGFTYGPHYTAKLAEDGKLLEPARLHAPPDLPEGELFLRLMEQTYIGGASTFVRTACYEDLGGLDASLIRSQDLEFALRLWRRFRGARVDHPIFYARVHAGLRGPAKCRWTPDESPIVWRHYNRKIFTKLRTELDLSDYLPRSVDWQAPALTDRRRALLQRMTIMMARGMYDEALEDLRLAMDDLSKGRTLSLTEREMLWRSASYGVYGDVIFQQPEYACRVRALCTGEVGQEVLLELARGLYWQAAHEMRSKKYKNAREVFTVAFRLLGFWGVFRALRREAPSYVKAGTTWLKLLVRA
jgi:glycosyltransferase involved in cell wall biosynthesis